jgi:ketosteroid isomerase-like protein
MEVNPAAKQQLGAKKFNEVMAFFHLAEEAIEAKDLKALMELYSEDYDNGGHDKKSVEQIWKRIFSTFGTMATQHYMELVNISATKKEAVKDTVVFRCSGLLMGVHDPEDGVVAIDNWTQQDHVLVKEAGEWKLIGTYGRDRKRLWFDKPIHPLF